MGHDPVLRGFKYFSGSHTAWVCYKNCLGRGVLVLWEFIPTMSAKSLGTLAMIYATDELQNPLPLKAMLCEGDMNNPVGRSDVFLHN